MLVVEPSTTTSSEMVEPWSLTVSIVFVVTVGGASSRVPEGLIRVSKVDFPSNWMGNSVIVAPLASVVVMRVMPAAEADPVEMVEPESTQSR